MSTSRLTTATLRTRWAAIGAAIAVTLGAGGGFGLARATLGSGERAVFVAIEPCRLVDTRPAPDTIGPRSTPIGAGETHNIQARGASGNCNLPTTATGVVLNVTAVGATAQTNLRIFPTGGTTPTVANLNPAPGAPPTPNSVTTRLANDGRFSIFNFSGSVNVVVDVAGYYTDHHHDDRYFTKAQSDTRYATPDALGQVASASKWISIDPLAVNLRGGATIATGFGALSGLNMPGGPTDQPQFDFGFTVPPDHTAGNSMTVEVAWHINQTACTVNLRTNFTSVGRPGGAHISSGFLNAANAVPAVANHVAVTSFPLNVGLRPGDAVILGMFRSFNDDTCSQPLKINGIRVLYS